MVPGLPDRIVLTRSQLPNAVNMPDAKGLRLEIRAAERAAYGAVVNSFEELEPEYVEEFGSVRGGKVWCIGPVSLCNKDDSDKLERGIKSLVDENKCLEWLDLQGPGSVVYVCFASLIGTNILNLFIVEKKIEDNESIDKKRNLCHKYNHCICFYLRRLMENGRR